MILQDYSALMNAILAGGLVVIGVILVVMIIMIIIALKVWKWAIQKFGGRVESLGQVFLTLILAVLADVFIGGLINLVAGAALVALLPAQYDSLSLIILALIVGIVIFPLVISKRHHMGFGSALVAWIVTAIILGLLSIVIIIVIAVVLLGGLMIFG